MFRAVGQTDRKKERHDKSNIRFSKFYESALETVNIVVGKVTFAFLTSTDLLKIFFVLYQKYSINKINCECKQPAILHTIIHFLDTALQRDSDMST